MITITLQQIKNSSLCEPGWKKLLKSKGGTKADYAAEFPLTDVLESNGLDDTLWCLRCLPEHDRIWRKYAAWCARQVEHLMTDQRSRDALNVADRHADGLATDEELAAAWDAAGDAVEDAESPAAESPAWAERAARDALWPTAGAAAWATARAAWAAGGAGFAAGAAQKQKLIEVLSSGEWK